MATNAKFINSKRDEWHSTQMYGYGERVRWTDSKKRTQTNKQQANNRSPNVLFGHIRNALDKPKTILSPQLRHTHTHARAH